MFSNLFLSRIHSSMFMQYLCNSRNCYHTCTVSRTVSEMQRLIGFGWNVFIKHDECLYRNVHVGQALNHVKFR